MAPPHFPSAFEGPWQPARRAFGLDSLDIGPGQAALKQVDVQSWPFCTLVRFRSDRPRPGPPVLIVPPLSGQFPIMMRDLIASLAPIHDIYVADWINARHVPVADGNLTFDDTVGYLLEMLRLIGPGANLLALCQAGVPALAATALATEEGYAPRALVLMAAPIDAMANPTQVVRLLRARSLGWFEANVLRPVPPQFPGAGRIVYPASMQLSGLLAYLRRHLTERGELFSILTRDQGQDPRHFPFLDLYSSVMDLPDAVFLQNIEQVFHRRALAEGSLRIGDRPVDCAAITETALMTIEGEQDDIAAPGQTEAAQSICPNIPKSRRRHLLLSDCGHFSTFYGARARNNVAPAISEFLLNMQ